MALLVARKWYSGGEINEHATTSLPSRNLSATYKFSDTAKRPVVFSKKYAVQT